MKPAKVAIFYYRLFHYRVQLFECMRELCLRKGIDLHIVHGQPTASEISRRDTGALQWADTVSNLSCRIGGVDLIWQPTPRAVKDADMVVLPQENRLLANYAYLIRRRFGGPLVALWGHGANLKSKHPSGFRERFRRRMMFESDYFFAYNQMTVDLITRAGYPMDRITSLNNSIDTAALKNDLASVDQSMIDSARASLAIPNGTAVALFCGSLYPNRKLPLLIDASDRVRATLPTYHVVIIGSGPELPMMEAAAQSRPWLHLVGPKMGIDKAVLFKMARVLLNPGAVGLVILDSFTAGVPLISTPNSHHGPEICYLRDGTNGVLAQDTPEEYAAAIVRILSDDAFSAHLSTNALSDGTLYSIEAMADNFVSGISACLQLRTCVGHSAGRFGTGDNITNEKTINSL